jgi:hypothetical protein
MPQAETGLPNRALQTRSSTKIKDLRPRFRGLTFLVNMFINIRT